MKILYHFYISRGLYDSINIYKCLDFKKLFFKCFTNLFTYFVIILKHNLLNNIKQY